MKALVPPISKTKPRIGGKINAPAIIEIINTVVASGKPGVLRAIQLEELGKIGPKKNPQSARPKPMWSLLIIANEKGRRVARMPTRIIV